MVQTSLHWSGIVSGARRDGARQLFIRTNDTMFRPDRKEIYTSRPASTSFARSHNRVENGAVSYRVSYQVLDLLG